MPQGQALRDLFANARDAQGNPLNFDDLNSPQLRGFFGSELVRARYAHTEIEQRVDAARLRYNEETSRSHQHHNATREQMMELIANSSGSSALIHARVDFADAFREHNAARDRITDLENEITNLQHTIPELNASVDDNAVRSAIRHEHHERANFLRAFVAPHAATSNEAVEVVYHQVAPFINEPIELDDDSHGDEISSDQDQ